MDTDHVQVHAYFKIRQRILCNNNIALIVSSSWVLEESEEFEGKMKDSFGSQT